MLLRYTKLIPTLPDFTIHWAILVKSGSSVWMIDRSSVSRVSWVYCDGLLIGPGYLPVYLFLFPYFYLTFPINNISVYNNIIYLSCLWLFNFEEVEIRTMGKRGLMVESDGKWWCWSDEWRWGGGFPDIWQHICIYHSKLIPNYVLETVRPG